MRVHRKGWPFGPYSATHLVGLLFVIALIAAPFAVLPKGAQRAAPNAISIRNFGKVNENYYRGSQPIAEEFAELKRLGIRTVIDLRKDREEEAERWARIQGLQYFNIPLTTRRAATDEQSAYFLTLVNDAKNWPVYVHCKGGRHRTGEMTAIYRITQNGWTAGQAYEEMKEYDFEDSFLYPRSLKKYVYSYYERFQARAAERAQVSK